MVDVMNEKHVIANCFYIFTFPHLIHFYIYPSLPSRKQPAAPYAEATRSGLLGAVSILRA
jgi:hypothetical protein